MSGLGLVGNATKGKGQCSDDHPALKQDTFVLQNRAR